MIEPQDEKGVMKTFNFKKIRNFLQCAKVLRKETNKIRLQQHQQQKQLKQLCVFYRIFFTFFIFYLSCKHAVFFFVKLEMLISFTN